MLLERVRRALASEYDILEEIAGGGMGVVFAARQRRLDRRVAVKILRPEQATAIAAERFLAEGRLLARLSHPGIVPVYDAGEADGLLYYAMEFVEGETLARRLERGPLPPAELDRLAQDLLAALGAAHALGVVHRDVKPANIFLRGGRALLGDFGIARWREPRDAEFTTPGELIGTPRYMSPEQRDGQPSTARTDVYAAGLVLWEAATGSRWPFYQPPGDADWSRVPAALAAPLRRALELEPARRWADAREFEAGLGRPARPLRRVAVFGAVALLGLLTWALWPRTPPPPSRGLPLELEASASSGGAAAERSLGDSALTYLHTLLAGNPDFYLPPPGELARDPRALRLAADTRISAGQVRFALEERSPPPAGGRPISAHTEGDPAGWPALVDNLAADLIFQLWQRSANDPFFPTSAIPPRPAERARLAQAEQLFSQGRWEAARAAYDAVGVGCLLCAFRALDIDRWLGSPRNPELTALLLRSQDSFPTHYRALIRAAALPPAARLVVLDRAATDYPGFFLAPFEYGDELFHRGPLLGRRRAEAILPFRNALLYRPTFQPGIEHLAGVLIAEGDSAGASREIDALLRLPLVSGLSGGLTLLRRLGFTWRFLPAAAARELSLALLRDPMVREYHDAPAAARLLMSMDDPRGAVEFGGMLVAWTERPDAALPGLRARLFGYAALGRLDSLRRTTEQLDRSSPDPADHLLGLELEAMLRGFDPDPAVRAGGGLRAVLEGEARRVSASSALRPRVQWALGVLAARLGDSAGVRAARAGLGAAESGGPLGHLLDAALTAPREPARALRLLPSLPTLDQEAEYADPLEDAVLHLLRAELQVRLDSLGEAARTLRWHEHTQLSQHLDGIPQPGELAWALGTLARWQRAAVLAASGDTGAERCAVNRGVARLWAGADPPFRARADSAARTLVALKCPASP